jgi:hypothetical protein
MDGQLLRFLPKSLDVSCKIRAIRESRSPLRCLKPHTCVLGFVMRLRLETGSKAGCFRAARRFF